MKKILLSLLTILTLVIMTPEVKANEKVKVYMFTKDGCSACASATDYFNSLSSSEYGDMFELVDLKIFDGNWNYNNENSENIMIKTLEHFDESTAPEDIATPLIVIGDYHTIGLSQDTSAVEEAIKSNYENENSEDVVKNIAKDNNIDLNEVMGIVEPGKYDTLIIIGIFVVVIGGFAGLVILGRKK